MDHETVVRQKMTEKYLLKELGPAARDEFEEHYFDCTDCAVDVRAGALFIDKSKIVLAQKPEPVSTGMPVPVSAPVRSGWLAGLRGLLRPAFALPVMALLLAVVGYQNLVTYPRLTRQVNRPQLLPYASVNLDAAGSDAPVIRHAPGEDFLLIVRIPPVGGYSHYAAELTNPAGEMEWSLSIPATPGQDRFLVRIPGAHLKAGSYTLAAHGVTASGERKDIGQASFEIQNQK
jgi:hypothetical protein